MVFLEVDLEEEISMHPLQGYFCLVQTTIHYNNPWSKTSQKMVLCLRKSVHGLKQSSHVWYSTFNDFMKSIGVVGSCVDGELCVLEDRDKVISAVILYIDDLCITANEGLIKQIKDRMTKRFWMHNLGSVSRHLGTNIQRNWEHHTINIHQHSFIWTILAMFSMEECRLVAAPMAMKLHKRKPNKEACHPTVYQSMIGPLMHVMTPTHPDIPDAIAVLSRYNHNRNNDHMVGLKHVFRYFNSMKDWPLRFRGKAEGVLRFYVDSDYAGCLDG